MATNYGAFTVGCPMCHEAIVVTTVSQPASDGHVGVTYHLGAVIDHQVKRHEVNRDRATSLGRPRLPRTSFTGRRAGRRHGL